MKKVVLILLLTFVQQTISKAQLQNSIFGIDNPSAGNYNFAEYDLTTNSFTTLLTLPISFLSTNYSATVDVDNGIYYFCDGQFLYSIDAGTGTLIATTNLNVPPLNHFGYVQYNPCDGNFYGLMIQTGTISLQAYDPSSGALNFIAPMPSGVNLCGGCSAVIRPAPNQYIFQASYAIIGFDIASGNLIYNTPIIDLPNESFGHMELKCGSDLLYGTSANPTVGIKYLSTVDPSSGIVAHVGQNGWTPGVFKPFNGGSCINQLTEEYFYSGVGHQLINANTNTGNLINAQSIGLSGEILFIRHFSDCDCELSSGTDEHSVSLLQLAPNPAQNILTINHPEYSLGKTEILITDIKGRAVNCNFQHQTTKTTLDISHLQPGVYFVRYTGEKGNYFGKFIKL
ncbi:MAG: T9SS type A sorting domain-containing protein [Bacteroidia bacterium]|nr:T9SS type A sorting domain-containing protein [Bacteroidia bacterium]